MGKMIKITESQFENVVIRLMEQNFQQTNELPESGMLEIPEDDSENEYVPEKREPKQTAIRLLNALKNDLNRVTSGNVAHVKMSLMGGVEYLLELVENDWKDCDETI